MVESPLPAEVVRMSDLGSTIMLRDSIDALFDQLEARPPQPLVLDFTGVEFISRSSAHEYLVRTARSRHLLSESGVCPEVARMIALVKRQLDRARSGIPRDNAPWSTSPPQSI